MCRAIIVLLILLSAPASCFSNTIEGIVTHVSDGDTIHVSIGKKILKVRLYGIDAPERKQRGGYEASMFVKDFILHEQVTLKIKDVDRYKRQVAIVTLPSGEELQDIILQAGHAWVYPRYCKDARCESWGTMEQHAKNEKRGLWKSKAVPPWIWRKTHGGSS